MRIVAAIGGGAFVLASLGVGLRLLWLAARRRTLPELWMGLGLFLMGGLGYPLVSVARMAVGQTDEVRTAFMIGAHACMVTGVTAMAVFNWQVFRPADGRARGAVASVLVALLAAVAWQGISPGFRAGAIEHRGGGVVAINVLAGMAMAWSCAEAIAQRRASIRRARYGLAEPFVSDRFRLWAIATGAATGITAFTTTLHLLEIDPAGSALGAMVVGPVGLCAAVACWLAFAPPTAYRRWVGARAAARG